MTRQPLLVVLVLMTGAGLVAILGGFWKPMFWAVAFALIFKPLDTWLCAATGGRRSLSAALTILIEYIRIDPELAATQDRHLSPIGETKLHPAIPTGPDAVATADRHILAHRGRKRHAADQHGFAFGKRDLGGIEGAIGEYLRRLALSRHTRHCRQREREGE